MRIEFVEKIIEKYVVFRKKLGELKERLLSVK